MRGAARSRGPPRASSSRARGHRPRARGRLPARVVDEVSAPDEAEESRSRRGEAAGRRLLPSAPSAALRARAQAPPARRAVAGPLRRHRRGAGARRSRSPSGTSRAPRRGRRPTMSASDRPGRGPGASRRGGHGRRGTSSEPPSAIPPTSKRLLRPEAREVAGELRDEDDDERGDAREGRRRGPAPACLAARGARAP